MWKNEHYFEITVEERLKLNHGIELAFKARGVYFSVEEDGSKFTPAPFIACMNYNRLTEEYSFHCGSFWWEERNILPVIAMSHELGHYIDVRDNFNLNSNEYHRVLGTKELELRAWLYAVEIMKEIGFKHWEVFYKYARNCLNSYFNDPFNFSDWRFGFNGVEPTFTNAIGRLQEKIGIDFEGETEERPQDLGCYLGDFMKTLERWRRTTEVPYREFQEEQETDPFKAKLKGKREAQKSLKKHLGAKRWEL